MKPLHILPFLLAVLAASAADNEWVGANTTSGTAADTDVDDPALWSLGHVPTGDEDAFIRYTSKASGANVYISPTSVFNPTSLFFYAGDWSISKNLYLDKSLVLEKLTLRTLNNSSGGNLAFFQNRLYVGTQTTDPVTITLTGNGDALDLTAYNGSWGLLNFGSSGNVLLDFTGSDITFSRGQQRTADYHINGGTKTENASLTANSTVQFSTPRASIHLEDQLLHGPSIGLGSCNFRVRSDQVWTADANAYISQHMRRSVDNASAPPPLIDSIDGGRLDNLGQINILVNHNAVDMSGNAVDAQPILGGTYGSLYMRGGNTTFRSRCFRLAGDVTLASACVEPVSGSTPATATDYSLIIATFSSAGGYWGIHLDGHELTLAKGLKLHEPSGSACSKLIHMKDSTLSIGGDLVIESQVAGATNATPNRAIGFRANEGTVLNLGGSFRTNCRCIYLNPNSSNNKNNLNFSLATVNLVGGADKVATFEVGDASTTTGIQRNTFSISNLCVGVSAAKTSHARLVNDFLNENDASACQEGEDKNDYRVGEKLIVHELSIGPDSILEVAGQNVEVGSSLAVHASGTLDLATGHALTGAARIENFYGLGDQTAAWGDAAPRVVDSSNRAYAFSPVYDSQANRTFWFGSPMGTTVLVR